MVVFLKDTINQGIQFSFYLLVPERKQGSTWVKRTSSLTVTTNRNIQWIRNLPWKLTGLIEYNDV